MYIQLRDSFNTIKFPSTRLSCVHTLRKEAQEIAHRYTCNSAGICAKNQRQIVPTEELCSRVTTASLVMGPTSCECTKAILDPRITANNSLHMVMELGNKLLLIIDLAKQSIGIKICHLQIWKRLRRRVKAGTTATTEFGKASEGCSLREV